MIERNFASAGFQVVVVGPKQFVERIFSVKLKISDTLLGQAWALSVYDQQGEDITGEMPQGFNYTVLSR